MDGKSNKLLTRKVASAATTVNAGATTVIGVNLAYSGYTVLGIIGVAMEYAMYIVNMDVSGNSATIGLYNYSASNRQQIVYVTALYVRN